jgi:hypothetical protein
MSDTNQIQRGPGEARYQFTAHTHYYGSAYIARCCGCLASCTSDAQTAALRAGRKHFRKFADLMVLPEKLYVASVKEIFAGQFTVTFTRIQGGQS